jgi:hypothetical protein
VLTNSLVRTYCRVLNDAHLVIDPSKFRVQLVVHGEAHELIPKVEEANRLQVRAVLFQHPQEDAQHRHDSSIEQLHLVHFIPDHQDRVRPDVLVG